MAKKKKTIQKDAQAATSESLLKESDAGCVILAAAMLQERLRKLHEAQIRVTVEETEKVFASLFDSPYSPLRDMNGLIQVGYAYGLLTLEQYRELDIVRRIRNEAAHELFEFRFEDSGVRELVNQLRAFDRRPHKFDIEAGVQLMQQFPHVTDTRWRFVNDAICLETEFLEVENMLLERELEQAKARRQASQQNEQQ